MEVLLNQESILDAWKEIGAISSYRQNSDKSADAYQAVMDIVDYRGMDWTQDKLNRIVETNDYISRYVYALLRSVEHIIKHYREYAQESADTARRKKNGDLWPNRPTRFSGFLMEEMELDNFGLLHACSHRPSSFYKNSWAIIRTLLTNAKKSITKMPLMAILLYL